MYIDWTKHIQDPEEKSRFVNQIYSARSVLERLYQILCEKEEDLDRSEVNIKVYELPNWAERQAHKNGNREVLRELKTLINLDQQKDTRNS